MTALLSLFCLSLMGTGFLPVASASGVQASMGPDGDTRLDKGPVYLRTFKTHSRLTIRVDSGVEAKLTTVPGGFELLLKHANLYDLGASMGSEEVWTRRIQSSKDSRLKNLEVQETREGLVFRGQWKFLEGDKGPADPRMEHFDYREKNPSAYVLDFWEKAGPTRAEARAAKVRAQNTALIERLNRESKERKDRRIAAEKAKAELNDTTPFCRNPLDASTDVFLSFLPVREKFDLSRWFGLVTPDRDFHYYEPRGDAKDAQYVRLALDLYDQGKHGLVIRTLDFLDAEHKESIYRQEMRFLRANALIKLGMEKQAIPILKELIGTGGQSPIAINSGLFMAKRMVESSQNLAALEQFLWLIKHYPKHEMAWVFHLGAAESAFALKQTERAADEYAWVTEHAPDRVSQAEAAIRLGDLYMMRGQYEQALAAYYQTVRRYPEESKKFPSIHVNRAEALYWLAQYDRAAEEFQKFLNEYPNHTAGWRATFRLGEIQGRQPGEQARGEARKFFLATVNNYPFTPGSVLARTRLMPCPDHGGYSVEASARFFEEEAKKFDGAGEIRMERYADFKGLAEIRTLIAQKQLDRSVDVSLRELRANPKPETRRIMVSTLQAIFRRTILDKLESGKKYEALAYYQSKGVQVEDFKAEAREADIGIPADYLLKLAQVAADMGLGETAQELAARYREYEKSALDGRAVATQAEPIEGDLRESEQAFTEAKAVWAADGLKEEKKIREHLTRIAVESPYSYEREVLLGLMSEKSGKGATALKHALKAELLLPKDTQSGDAGQLAAEKDRLTHWIARLQASSGEKRVAIDLYRKLQESKVDAGPGASGIRSDSTRRMGLDPVPTKERLVLAEGEILGGMGRWGEAAAAYARLADSEGQTADSTSNQLMYEYSRALEKSGAAKNRAKSRSVLERLAESQTDDFWRQLARQGLADETGKYQPKSAKEGGK